MHNGQTSIELIVPSILGYEIVARRVVATFADFVGHRFAVDVSDTGTNPLAIIKEPKTIEEKLAGAASLRGMGMMLMAALADEFIVEPSAAPGNTVRLIWYQREVAHT